MLLIPPTLGLVHQLKFILEQPFVICALDNRSRLARNLLAALLFIAFRAVMAVSIPSIALGALLFRGSKPCTWESGASYYAYMTGQTLITPVKTGSLIVWQAMTIWLTVLLVSILFLSINLSCESHQLGSILSWGVCLALTVWNLLYFAVGFCSVCVFCFFTNGLSCFTILPHDVLPCDALTCLLPFGFALAISLLAFCLCIFCSFVWGQVFAISCLVAVSFTEFPSPFLCYAMLIRCRAMSPAGFDERAGLLFYLIFAGIVCFIGMFLFLQLDLFPGLQRRPQ